MTTSDATLFTGAPPWRPAPAPPARTTQAIPLAPAPGGRRGGRRARAGGGAGGGARLQRHPDAARVDCAGGVLTPGLVDSHTHAVFGRWRTDEYELRCQGVPYMEIARRGGGINASVRDLRARSRTSWWSWRCRVCARCWSRGTTTAEVKSGYGLSTADELKTLRAIRRLATAAGRAGPHLPGRARGAAGVPRTARRIRGPARRGDDPRGGGGGARPLLRRLHGAGRLRPRAERAHPARRARARPAPQAARRRAGGSGGAELAAELGAASADHLGAISDDGIRALAGVRHRGHPAPATLFFLGRPVIAPARALLDAGATVALATDFNPGSSPTPSLPFVMTAACSQMGMSPAEALRAATAGGAGRAGTGGRAGNDGPGRARGPRALAGGIARRDPLSTGGADRRRGVEARGAGRVTEVPGGA
jgi:imidazolonepropionase